MSRSCFRKNNNDRCTSRTVSSLNFSNAIRSLFVRTLLIRVIGAWKIVDCRSKDGDWCKIQGKGQ